MPSFRVPIAWAVRDPDPAGPVRRFLRAAVAADVADRHGGFIRVENFVVDTGATATTVSATWARAHEVEVPPATASHSVRTATGLVPSTVHDGELRLRFPQLPDRVFRLYCIFSEDVPPASPLLLGLNDLLEVFRITFDGAGRPDAAMGSMLFETV